MTDKLQDPFRPWSQMTNEKLPQTVNELCDYIEEHAESIYVREKIGDAWASFSLAEMDGKSAIRHAMKFIKERRTPVRVLPPKETV
jgi:hypothetical protein